jgi:hypothetical protein
MGPGCRRGFAKGSESGRAAMDSGSVTSHAVRHPSGPVFPLSPSTATSRSRPRPARPPVALDRDQHGHQSLPKSSAFASTHSTPRPCQRAGGAHMPPREVRTPRVGAASQGPVNGRRESGHQLAIPLAVPQRPSDPLGVCRDLLAPVAIPRSEPRRTMQREPEYAGGSGSPRWVSSLRSRARVTRPSTRT